MSFHFSACTANRAIQTIVKLLIDKRLLVVLEIYLAKLYDWRVPPDLVLQISERGFLGEEGCDLAGTWNLLFFLLTKNGCPNVT